MLSFLLYLSLILPGSWLVLGPLLSSMRLRSFLPKWGVSGCYKEFMALEGRILDVLGDVLKKPVGRR